MNSLGLLVATRRYWPLTGGWENVWSRLLGELARRGHRITVLTPQLLRDGPVETDRGGVRIVRLPPPTGGAWGEWRYVQSLTKAIRDRRSACEVVVAAGLRGDAYAALTACRGGPAVVLQPERPGLSGDCHWQIEARCGMRVKRRCYRANAYLALTPLIEREVIAAGYARSRIHLVRLGVPLPPPNAAAARREARRTLAQADPALALDAGDRLVVCCGRLRCGNGLEGLLTAWRRVAVDVPQAMLWLVGEGPDAARLRESAAETPGDSRIRFTGAFDDLDDVYRAADVVVVPALQDGLAATVLEAASYGLPTVTSDLTTHRDWLTPGVETCEYPRHDSEALSTSLVDMLTDEAKASALGAAARDRIVRDYSLPRLADDYERVLTAVSKPAKGRAP